MPARHTPEAVVAAVTGELLHNGNASRFYQALVKETQVAVSVDGGVNWPLGSPFEFNDPTLMTSFVVAPAGSSKEKLLAAYDAVIEGLAAKGPSEEELKRVRAKMLSDWYGKLEIPISRASALSHAVLFDGNADSVNSVAERIANVNPASVKAFTAKYLVPQNRTLIYRVPEVKK
jgi:predicted Zn-dependent peptidase